MALAGIKNPTGEGNKKTKTKKGSDLTQLGMLGEGFTGT
jgi:hypothetical protein